MKKTLLILALALVQLTSWAQAPEIEWQKNYGGSAKDKANSIQKTSDGGYILAGTTYSSDGYITFFQQSSDLWVVKLNSTGSIEWQKTFGGGNYDYALNIKQTLDGGYVVVGNTYSTQGDVTGHHGVPSDVWVVKMDATGTLQWQKSLGGTANDFGYDIIQSTDGGYIVACSSTSTDGDVAGNHGGVDAWIVKLSNTGDLVWQKTLGGTGFDAAYSVQQTANGGCIIAGYTASNDGDVTGNHGGQDTWVVKLSATGTIQWQKTVGGTMDDFAYNIQQTAEGGYIVAGYTKSNDGDLTGNHGGGSDAWVVKLNSSGNIEWQKTLGGSGTEDAMSVQQTADGGYIVGGYTDSNDGDVTGNHGGNDAWVVKLSTTGIIKWQKALGGSTGWDQANSIQQTADFGYIVAGFSNSYDGDITVKFGDYDFWVVKLAADPLANDTFKEKLFKVYPNPTQGVLYLQTLSTNCIDKIIITDIMGKVILEQTTNTNQVNVEKLANGLYIIQGFSGKEQFTSKFVKE